MLNEHSNTGWTQHCHTCGCAWPSRPAPGLLHKHRRKLIHQLNNQCVRMRTRHAVLLALNDHLGQHGVDRELGHLAACKQMGIEWSR